MILYIAGRTADLFLEINAGPSASFRSNLKQRNAAEELRDVPQSVELRRQGRFYIRRAKSLATSTQAGHDGIRPIAHVIWPSLQSLQRRHGNRSDAPCSRVTGVNFISCSRI